MTTTMKCSLCGDILQTTHSYDPVRCSCGNVFLDDGDVYFRVAIKTPDTALILKDGEFVPFPAEE